MGENLLMGSLYSLKEPLKSMMGFESWPTLKGNNFQNL